MCCLHYSLLLATAQLLCNYNQYMSIYTNAKSTNTIIQCAHVTITFKYYNTFVLFCICQDFASNVFYNIYCSSFFGLSALSANHYLRNSLTNAHICHCDLISHYCLTIIAFDKHYLREPLIRNSERKEIRDIITIILKESHVSLQHVLLVSICIAHRNVHISLQRSAVKETLFSFI